MTLKQIFRTGAVVCAIFSLGACATASETMTTLREKISSIELPKLTPGRTDQSEAQLASSQVIDCPPVTIINDLSSLHQFVQGASKIPDNAISTAKITGVKSTCRTNVNNMIVELDVTFDGELGPRARNWNASKPSFAYPYFIAVTKADGKISAKEVFAATLSYDKDQTHLTQNETLRQVIPTHGALFSKDYQIMVGFQLTDEELAYNRSGAALKTAVAPVTEPAAVKKPAPAKKVAKKKVAPPKPKTKPEAEAAAVAPAPVPEPAPAPAAAVAQPETLPAPAPVEAAAPAPVEAAAPAPAATPPVAAEKIIIPESGPAVVVQESAPAVPAEVTDPAATPAQPPAELLAPAP